MRKKKVAILVGHNTAFKAYADIFTRMGFDIYIPLYECATNKTYIEDIKSYRTIEDSVLDNFTFFFNDPIRRETNYLKAFKRLSEIKFDYIITSWTVNQNLNELLIKIDIGSSVKCMAWGHMDVDPIRDWKNAFNRNVKSMIDNSSHAEMLLCHNFLKRDDRGTGDMRVCLLGTPEISHLENTWNPKKNHLTIVKSYLYGMPDRVNRIEILGIELAKKDPSIVINICGKTNRSLKNSCLSQYPFFNFYDFETEQEVQSLIQRSSMLMWFPWSKGGRHSVNIFQYPPQLASCIGCPILYPINQTIETITNNTNSKFRYHDPMGFSSHVPTEQVYELLNYSNERRASEANYQKVIYDTYKIDSVLDSYKEIFK